MSLLLIIYCLVEAALVGTASMGTGFRLPAPLCQVLTKEHKGIRAHSPIFWTEKLSPARGLRLLQDEEEARASGSSPGQPPPL